jgi:hypothetical protein
MAVIGRNRRPYRRLCLTCGFVVSGLYKRRPWPIIKRCKLCRFGEEDHDVR